MGLQLAKQSAAIFSGIPVLRGDFGGGGGKVRQFCFNPTCLAAHHLGFPWKLDIFKKTTEINNVSALIKRLYYLPWYELQ
jgi:hypothetical protein